MGNFSTKGIKEYEKLLSEGFGVMNVVNWMLMPGWLATALSNMVVVYVGECYCTL